MRYRLDYLIYELTERCNQNCVYCYNYWLPDPVKRERKEDVDVQKWVEITDEILKDVNVNKIVLSGGEPLLYDNIIKLCQKLKDRSIKITLITNGSLLTEEKVKGLLNSGVDLFELTLLSYDSAVHNRLTGSENFESTIRAMKLIKRYKGELCTTIIGTSENIEQIKKTAELAIALDSDQVMFNRVNLGGRGLEETDLFPTKKEIRKVLSDLDDLSKKYGTFIHCGVPIPYCVADPEDHKHLSFGRCPSGLNLSYITVESSGDLRTCNHSPLKLINILEDDFEDIFETDVWKDFTSTYPERCEGCKYLKKCHASCRAAGYVSSGSWGEPDPFIV